MEFNLDKKKRSNLSYKIIPATIGGKIALTFCTICTVLFFVSLFAIIHYWGFERNSDDAIRWMISVMVFGCTLMGGPIGFIITYRQRNINLSMRTQERLFIDNGLLYYFYRLSNDFYGLSSFVVDLKKTNISIGKNGQYIFKGGVYLHRYESPGVETRIVPLEEMQNVEDIERVKDYLEMWDYWQPNLYEAVLEEQEKLAKGGQQQVSELQFPWEEYQQPEQPTQQPEDASNSNADLFVEKPPSKAKKTLFYSLACIFGLAILAGLSIGNLVVLAGLAFVVYLIAKAKGRA